MLRKSNTLPLLSLASLYGMWGGAVPGYRKLRLWNRSVVLAIVFILVGSHVIFGQTDTPSPVGTPPAGAAAAPAKPADSNAKEPLPVSIFFTPEEQQRIRVGLIAYEKSKLVKANVAESKANDFLNQITDTEPKKEEPKKEKEFIYPQFFLNSLVYHGADDWVVIINNQRFASHGAQASAELTIVDVDNEKVGVQWKPKRMDKVNESWEKNQNNDIMVDPTSKQVIFTLRPNQTFSSYVMRVLEGKVRPIKVMLKQDSNGDEVVDPSPQQGGNEADADTKNKDNKKIENITTDDMNKNVGVEGLNKTYKKMGLEN